MGVNETFRVNNEPFYDGNKFRKGVLVRSEIRYDKMLMNEDEVNWRMREHFKELISGYQRVIIRRIRVMV